MLACPRSDRNHGGRVECGDLALGTGWQQPADPEVNTVWWPAPSWLGTPLLTLRHIISAACSCCSHGLGARVVHDATREVAQTLGVFAAWRGRGNLDGWVDSGNNLGG